MMKIETVARAASLGSALTAMTRLNKALAEAVPADESLFQIAVGRPFATSSVGAPAFKALTIIDIETGKIIVTAAEKIIRAELTAMGVEL